MTETPLETISAQDTVDRRWNWVLDHLPAIGKDSVNKQQGFKYRSIDTVLNHLNPLLAAAGVHIVPVAQTCERDVRSTRSGGSLNVCYITVTWEIRGVDGGVITAQTLGEGTDAGDKATSKAQTMAFKYLLWPSLAIAENEDPDGETVEESAPERKSLAPSTPPVVAGDGSDPGQATTRQINWLRRLLRDAGYLSGSDIEHFVRETIPETDKAWDGNVAALPRTSISTLIDLLKPKETDNAQA